MRKSISRDLDSRFPSSEGYVDFLNDSSAFKWNISVSLARSPKQVIQMVSPSQRS